MKDIVERRLETYNLKTKEDEINALKEITQEILLYSFYKIGMFEKVCFLGGTNLRIIHGLQRFSEDLEFATTKKDTTFDLHSFLNEALVHINAYGYELSVDKKPPIAKTVQGLFLKDNSIKKILTFKFLQDKRAKIKIKVEVDTNPPEGADNTIEYVDFPFDFPVSSHDLPTLMAGKIHALLCRPYCKGRDWFDFLWYMSRKVAVNMTFLENALHQTGPWSKGKPKVDLTFVSTELKNKIDSIDWKDIRADVRRFLSADGAKSLESWGVPLFTSKLPILSHGLTDKH